MRRHPAAAVDLLAVERAGALRRRVVAHLRERPREVHRGRPRRGEHALRLGEILAAQRGEREPVRGGDADRGAPRMAMSRIAAATSAERARTRARRPRPAACAGRGARPGEPSSSSRTMSSGQAHVTGRQPTASAQRPRPERTQSVRAGRTSARGRRSRHRARRTTIRQDHKEAAGFSRRPLCGAQPPRSGKRSFPDLTSLRPTRPGSAPAPR